MISKPDYFIRLAESGDQRIIRTIVRGARINPMNLDWRNFILAVGVEAEIIGCGQIKTHRDGTKELASIAVRQEWRKMGIASTIIRRLIDRAESHLWLVCRAELAVFYMKFGFTEVEDISAMPTNFRRMRSVSRYLSYIIPQVGNFSIMTHQLTPSREY
ncbi:MAG: GNAT family N-acetyltransferase [Anaerolineales bacterium]|nr:GNAT family N-acetyltransferase [Anaerolineales bacterium]